MSIMSTITRLASSYRTHRRRIATRVEIAALPRDIQKDIGWPVADTERHRRTIRTP